MLNIPEKLDSFDKVINTSFCIFEKRDFLNKDQYMKLKETFPNISYFNKIENKGKKLSFDNKNDNFFKFLDENKVWLEFYKTINSKNTVMKFYNLLRDEFNKIEERRKLKNINYINYDYKSDIFTKIKKKIYSIFYSNVRVGFQFSLIGNNCFIPPHCDTVNKLLSLMIYFPDQDESDNNQNLNLGTNFYIKNDNSKEIFDGWDSKLLSKEDAKKFYENYKILYKSPFKGNKLVGFIKNGKSWHDVSPFMSLKNFYRKSINVNFYLI